MLSKLKKILPLAVILAGLLLPDANRAGPPLPPESGSLIEDGQWLRWQNRYHQSRDVPLHEWKQVETTHFHFHFLPGTAAERDIHLISKEAEESLHRMTARLDLTYDGQLDIYLVDRLFWQGGAAYGGDEILISYFDRNYADVPFNYYLDHELTHVLSHSLIPEGGTTRTLLIEGLAVWTTGGHYGPEPIHALAAALPAMERAIPLERLLDDFRNEAHEIAYLQGASFVGWLIEQHGLDTFKSFYGAADEPERFYGASYEELEAAWREWLEQEWGRESEEQAAWLEARLRFFDTMRRYQRAYDPFARDLPSPPSSWSPSKQHLYSDRVNSPIHYALETQLVVASERLACDQDPAATHALLDEIEAVIEAGSIVREGSLASRLALARQIDGMADGPWERDRRRFRDLAVPTLVPDGWAQQEVVRLELEGDGATALIRSPSARGTRPRAFEMHFEHRADGWRLEQKTAVQTESLIPRSNRLCRS